MQYLSTDEALEQLTQSTIELRIAEETHEAAINAIWTTPQETLTPQEVSAASGLSVRRINNLAAGANYAWKPKVKVSKRKELPSEVIQIIKEMRGNYTQNEIAVALNEQGFRTITHKEWSAQNVKRVWDDHCRNLVDQMDEQQLTAFILGN